MCGKKSIVSNFPKMLPFGWLIAGEISHFLGLTFMELVEMVAIATIISGGAAGIGLVVTAFKTRKQTKIDSATLSLELIKRVRDEDFAKVVDAIYDGDTINADPVILERLLNHMDMIAKFHEDGLLEFDHIRQIYGGMLERIRDDAVIQTFITKNDRLYEPLIRLYNRV